MKHFLEEQGIVTRYPREAIQIAFQTEMIQREALWLKMIADRNLTVHTYQANLADEVVERIQNRLLS